MKVLVCESCNGHLSLNSKVVTGNIIKCEYCGGEHILENRFASYSQDNSFLLFLKDKMEIHFSLEYLKNICCELVLVSGIPSFDFEDISGSGKSGKIRELLLKGKRHGTLYLIVEIAMRFNRPFAVEVHSYKG